MTTRHLAATAVIGALVGYGAADLRQPNPAGARAPDISNVIAFLRIMEPDIGKLQDIAKYDRINRVNIEKMCIAVKRLTDENAGGC